MKGLPSAKPNGAKLLPNTLCAYHLPLGKPVGSAGVQHVDKGLHHGRDHVSPIGQEIHFLRGGNHGVALPFHRKAGRPSRFRAQAMRMPALRRISTLDVRAQLLDGLLMI